MATNLKINRDIALKIRQRFEERVDIVNDERSLIKGKVYLDDDVFGCNGFEVILRTEGKNPENCVHVIVVDILGIIISVKNPKIFYVGEGIVMFEDDKGSGVIFDVVNDPRKP